MFHSNCKPQAKHQQQEEKLNKYIDIRARRTNVGTMILRTGFTAGVLNQTCRNMLKNVMWSGKKCEINETSR